MKITKKIRSRLTVIPVSETDIENEKQVNAVFDFLRGEEDGEMTAFAISKVIPKPNHLISDSVEEDDWLLLHRGTRDKVKNACIIGDKDNTLLFDTTWRPVLPIMYILAKKFPNIDFIYEYTSHHAGKSAGIMYVSQGEVITAEPFEDYSKEAYDVAFELRPHLKMLYKWNASTGQYEYDTSDFQQALSIQGFYTDRDGVTIYPSTKKKRSFKTHRAL